MEPNDLDQRLSRISTMWTMLRQAHGTSDRAARAARQQLMERYCGAVYRYLLSAVRDPHAAEDLTQEFALRFISGRFQKATPSKGRFRDYVKTALFHLVDDYRHRQGKRPQHLTGDVGEPVAASANEAEHAFLASWREELLAKTWNALAEHERQSGQPYHTVLQLRAAHPEASSAELAERVSAQLARSYSATAVRQLLHRARERFAELLLDETRHSLGKDADDHLEAELGELNLLKYCRTALDRRGRGTGG